MSRNKTILAVFIVALAILAAGVGCGGGDDTTSGASGATGGAGSIDQEAADVEAESAARTTQTAMEVYATDNNGSYSGASNEALRKIEPSVPGSAEVEAQEQSYKLTVPSAVGDNSFSISRDASGVTDLTCEVPGEGNCPASGRWD